MTLSKIEHQNLVRFLGYLEHGDERLILVEYVNNGTLREHLDGKQNPYIDNLHILGLNLVISVQNLFSHMSLEYFMSSVCYIKTWKFSCNQ